MTKAKQPANTNGRWKKGGERYSAKDAATLRRIFKENGWRNGAKVIARGIQR